MNFTCYVCDRVNALLLLPLSISEYKSVVVVLKFLILLFSVFQSRGALQSSPGNSMSMSNMGGPAAPPQMGPPGGPGGTPHTPQDGDGDAFNMVPAFNDSVSNNPQMGSY